MNGALVVGWTGSIGSNRQNHLTHLNTPPMALHGPLRILFPEKRECVVAVVIMGLQPRFRPLSSNFTKVTKMTSSPDRLSYSNAKISPAGTRKNPQKFSAWFDFFQYFMNHLVSLLYAEVLPQTENDKQLLKSR